MFCSFEITNVKAIGADGSIAEQLCMKWNIDIQLLIVLPITN
jgi:hypothetical protein